MMLKRLALTAFLVLAPTAAQAGLLEDGVYSSNLGYTVRPPAGWTRLDTATMQALIGHVPRNIDTKSLDRFDVIFFPEFSKVKTDIEADDKRLEKNKETLAENKNAPEGSLLPPISDDTTVPEFSPSISIMILSSKPSVTSSEMAKAFAASISESIGQAAVYAKDFKFNESTYDDYLAPGPGFKYNISFRAQSRDILVEQYVVFGPGDKTYVISCTSDANAFVEKKRWCQDTVDSMKL